MSRLDENWQRYVCKNTPFNFHMRVSACYFTLWQRHCVKITRHDELIICDAVSEKVPYCGTNSVILDQLFSHFCDSIFINTAHGATNIVVPDQTPCIMWYCSAITYLFADDVTYNNDVTYYNGNWNSGRDVLFYRVTEFLSSDKSALQTSVVSVMWFAFNAD